MYGFVQIITALLEVFEVRQKIKLKNSIITL